MSKVITASSICVLLIGSSALAALVQDQYTGIGLLNSLDVLGQQQVSSAQHLVAENSQSGVSSRNGLAKESLFATIDQSADAGGAWSQSLLGVVQELGLEGEQAQTVGIGSARKAQNQTLGLDAIQTLSKTEGKGQASALHSFAVNEDQYARNAAGRMNQSSEVTGTQTSSLSGQYGAVGVVQGLGLDGEQVQTVGTAGQAQNQMLGLEAAQTLELAEGTGQAFAGHSFAANDSQYARNAAGWMSQSSEVTGAQTSSLSGQYGAQGNVETTVGVTTRQSQAAH